MKKKTYSFSAKKVAYYFDHNLSSLGTITPKANSVLLVDEHLSKLVAKKLPGWKMIAIDSGESNKVQATVDRIIDQLISLEADRSTCLVGIGGGVLTDLAGFAAAIYMRGIRCGYVPSSILGMVDAAIGGKNGIDVGIYKNLVGTIRQPDFLLYDITLLDTLPQQEWVNGFAEIIKHACIRDAKMFALLEKSNIEYFKKNKKALQDLIQRNAAIKSEIVQKDEFEKGDRKLLNFGHTIGHAIENVYQLSHGQAISIGMAAAAILSEQFTNFKESPRLINLLSKYGLPTLTEFNAKKAFEVLKMDKKRSLHKLNYILLNKIGEGVVKPIPIDQLEKLIHSIIRAR